MDLLLIHIPVPESRVIAVPLSKPPVVQDKHLYAHFLGSLGDIVKLLLVKLKVSGLPVVYQDGPGLFHKAAPNKVLPKPVMEMMRKGLQARAGKGHGSLRRHKTLPGL